MKLFAVIIAAVLAIAAPAAAAPDKKPLPTPDTYRIEVPKSLGGISLGDDFKAAHKAWGGEGTCGHEYYPDSCFWGPLDYGKDGRAEIGEGDDGVEFVEISWDEYTENGKQDIRRSIARFETGEGVHLGTKMTEVGKAYPKAERIKHDISGRIQAYVVSDGTSAMRFGGGKFVEYIALYRD